MTELDQCPKCGVTSTETGEDYYKGDIYMLQYICKNCSTMWYAIYQFVGKELIE